VGVDFTDGKRWDRVDRCRGKRVRGNRQGRGRRER
jgi:hypothetical protein